MLRGLALSLVLAGLFEFSPIAAAQSSGSPEPLDERRVYLPVEELDVVIDRDQRGVVLSRAEYEKLTAAARASAERFPPASQAVVLSRADYAAEIVEGQLVLDANVDFDQLRPGWQAVELPFRHVAVERAALDGKPARLGREGAERTLVLFSDQPGRHRLALKLSTPLASLGSDKVAAVGLAPAPAGSLRLSLPAGQFLHVDDLPLERPAAGDQPAEYAVAVGGKRELSVRITGRQAAQQSASLVFAATAIGLHVAPEERTWQAVTTLNVFGQPIDALQFQIPKSLEIVAVESTGLERWEIAPGPTQSSTTLKLVYRQPFAETRTVTFRGVSTSVLGQPWSVPTLGLTGATSHLVRVLVQHPAGLRLQPVEATSIRRVSEEEGEMQDLAASPDMEIRVEAAHRQHFAAWRDDFALLFVTQPRARELQATIATRLDIDSREIGLQASIMVQTRFAPLFELDLALPVEWTVSDVLVGTEPARWRVVPVDAGSHRVRVTFAPPLAIDGKARLTLQARRIPAENWPIEDQTLEIPLPEVYLPDVGVTDGRYMVAADPDLDLVIADLTGLDPVRLSDQEQRLARAPRLAYEHQDTRFQGTLRVSRKPMRLAVQTLAFHRLDRELLASYLETRLYSQGGGVRTLEVALPDLTGTDLRFRLLDATRGEGPRPPEITEQTAAPAANGERVWTLQFDRRAFGLLWLVVDLQAPRTAEETSFSLPGLRIVGAERQSGQVVIEAGPEQQLAFEAFDVARAPLSEIDPADVLAPAEYVPRERIVAAYQTKRPGFSVALRETRFDRQAVPTAVCDRAVLATVIGAAGEMQHQASFALRATGVQSVRVELPHGAELWAAQIDGQPIEVRVAAAADGGAAAYLIPLPPTAQPAAVRRLQLDYQTATNRLTSSGTLGQTPPRLAVVSGQGETQPLEILERDWQVFHPAWTEITSSRGQFEPVQPPSPSSLLGRLQRAFQHEVTHDLQGKGSVVGVAFVLFGIAWLAGRRRGRRGVLAVTAAGGVMVLIGLVLTVTTAKAPFMYSSYETAAPADRMADGTVSFSAPGAKSPALDFSGGVSASGGRSSIAMDGELDASIAQDMPMSSTEIAKQSQDLAKEARTRHRSVGGASQDASSPPWGTITGALPNAAMPSDISDGVSSLAPRGKSTRLGQNNTFIAGGLPEGGHLNDEGEFIEALDQAAQPPLPPQREDQDGDAEPFVETVFAVQDAAAAAGAGIPQLAAANNAPTSLSRRQGARLSLAIQLEPEPGSRRTDFHYAGSPPGGVDPTLEIDYQQREGLSLTRLVWQAAVLLLFWLARHSSGGVRSTLAVFGLVFPLALLPIVPWDMLPHLDGLFLGTLCGLALWLALLLRGVPQRWRRFVTGGAPGMAALVLAAGLVWGSDSLLAQERPAAGAEPVPAADAESSPRSGRPTVVIPYDAGDDPTRGERFVLPFDRFLELWNAAHPDEALDRAAPRGGVVAEALYAVEVPPPVAGKPGT
ncbi:MAG: hypothetical protein ACKV0T_29480, partial [Planctomycetales bacterium]